MGTIAAVAFEARPMRIALTDALGEVLPSAVVLHYWRVARRRMDSSSCSPSSEEADPVAEATDAPT